MRKAEIAMAVGLIALAMVMLQQARQLPISWTAIGPGSGFFPFWLAVAFGLTAAIVLVQQLRASGPEGTFIPRRSYAPLLVAFLPMAAAVALIRWLGIYIGGGLYLAGYMWLVGRFRLLPILLVSILLPIALFFIFERWFLLLLPKGVILERLLYGPGP